MYTLNDTSIRVALPIVCASLNYCQANKTLSTCPIWQGGLKTNVDPFILNKKKSKKAWKKKNEIHKKKW